METCMLGDGPYSDLATTAIFDEQIVFPSPFEIASLEQSTLTQHHTVDSSVDTSSSPAFDSPWLAGRRIRRPDRNLSFLHDLDPSLLDVDYTALFDDAIDDNDQNLVARCLLAAAKLGDQTFISSIDNDTFTHVLEIMQPTENLMRLLHLQQDVSPSMVKRLGLTRSSLAALLHSRLVDLISVIRRNSGCRLDLNQCKLALRSAALLDNKQYGHRAWQRLIEEGNTPDTECWNNFMSCTVWMHMFEPDARHQLRVIPFNMEMRQKDTLEKPFQTFRVGKGGVKEEASKTLGHMLASRCAPNEQTWTIYMTAAAREGDLATVKGTLKKIWNIDVEAIMQAEPGHGPPLEVQMALDSGLYPTERLLFTIAHCFSINNDIPTALRLVDTVSHAFNVVIPREVWAHLFEWTFVLSIPRQRREQNALQGTNAGRLPLPAVENLWSTLRGSPYHIEPTMPLYNRLIKHFFIRNNAPAIYEKMLEALQPMKEANALRVQSWKAMQAEARRPASKTSAIEVLREDFETNFLISRRNNYYFKKWLRYLLASSATRVRTDAILSFSAKSSKEEDPNTLPSPGRTKQDPESSPCIFTLDVIPQILYHWRVFAPDTIYYEVPGGLVQFNTRDDEERDRVARRQVRWAREEGDVLDNLQLRSPRVLFQRIGVNMNPMSARMKKIVSKEQKGRDEMINNHNSCSSQRPVIDNVIDELD
ncbi:hypothetical protein K431DRAFT_348342 [Polychaeton citri CBS 116435]|uniref:Uncharacterized protein n=1 Tax=Polychaeton citri CBS 116435 TaxID=1314669 RepID=A0A9P4Q3L1_9PEZI|nr:hypothetical protein K431DRAFT_348342 [Polychaeton citri CBS 116435]